MHTLSNQDKECLRILMHNLAVTLSSQQFQEDYQMQVQQEANKMNMFTTQPIKQQQVRFIKRN